jgi:hypothetical protein
MKDETIPVKSILKDIICLEKSLMKLLDKGKPYEKLLRYVIFKCSVYDYESAYPRISELSNELKIPAAQIKKQLQQIHADAVQLAHDGDLFSVKRYSYTFWLESYNRKLYIKYYDLPHVPRVGETVQMPCFDGYMESRIYYVDSISHEYYSDEIETTIYLKHGFYNSYFQFKKDEVFFKNMVAPIQQCSITDYELKKVIVEHLGQNKWSL